ncbi:MAG: hypothetical protein Q9167_005958 [Letrouitia subvulpina]
MASTKAAPAPAPLDFDLVQGDVLLGGIPKKTETYFFFQIKDTHVHEFRAQLAHLIPLITSTAQVQHDRKRISESKKEKQGHIIKIIGVNIAFSHKGLVKLGITDQIGDKTFNAGMLADAENLGDPGTKPSSGPFDPDWKPEFKKEIHGMILVAGDSRTTTHEKMEQVTKIFKVGEHDASIHRIFQIIGDVRPGKEQGHEHFGFADGISQPAVKDVDLHPLPGQETIRQGIVLLGREGDTPDVDGVTSRPSWALDGTFLAFRLLSQLVPEFNTFLEQNPIPKVLPPSLGSELLGARLVGRWKSGAPIDITPTADDPALGKNANKNNNFRYDFPEDPKTQTRCPFAAHTRKTNPRADLEDLKIPTESRRIIRSGIQFGPEVTAEEASSKKTKHDRGLLFVGYQSNLANGFQFIQRSWANNAGFPIQKPVTPGLDPLIGQTIDSAARTMSGTNPQSQNIDLSLPVWVVPKGGEYFFTPSIRALKQRFALHHGQGHHDEL